MRKHFITSLVIILLFVIVGGFYQPNILYSLLVFIPIAIIGIVDMLQIKHTIRRNFPVIGHFRYLFEAIRPEINQYFVESNSDGVPFSREQRSIVYQRSKHVMDTLPFGTQMRVYDIGYEWATHSLAPVHVAPESLRVTFGGPDCKKPYSGSVLNISGMSYGSLSKRAILALNGGAKMGNFSHNTGEGGLSPYHLEPGGDIVWQLGTAYFGCRTADGHFHEEKFATKSRLPQVKMIEIKLSQGAKPSHGGILPAAKVDEEISRIRDVPMGQDIISPPAHSTFSTPIGLMLWIKQLRELSEGKPIGFKLCLGKKREFIALAKAMLKTGITPDFITLDGGEGGTGAAPIEFSNSIGFPMRDGLVFVHNVLVGMGLRKQIRVIASGKTISGFDMVLKFALGADACNAGRSMMLALGCIQALRCNTNRCPTGVATQDRALANGLDVKDKRVRVASYHQETVKSVADIIGAIGMKSSVDIRPWHIHRRTGPSETKHLGEIYNFIKENDLLAPEPPKGYARAFNAATAESFMHVDQYEAPSPISAPA